MSDIEQIERHVVVERWRRSGHDRAYVRVRGEQVGYRNLQTGSVWCDDARHLGVVVEATEHLLSAAPSYTAGRAQYDDAPPPTIAARPATPRRVTAPPTPPTPPAPPVLLPDRDLAANEPGADVEVAVARRLGKLSAGWHVLHAIPVGDKGSDIDHVVVGPPGVVTINTKHHPDANVWVRGDTVKINGHNQRYVRNSRHEAQRVARLITAKADSDVPVRAVIAIVGAHGGFVVKEQPSGDTVAVVLHRRLAGYLRSLPVALEAPDVERIYSAARHLATWQPSSVEWADF